MRKRDLEQQNQELHKAWANEREQRLRNENSLIRLGLIPEDLQREIEKSDYGIVEFRPFTHPLPDRVIDWDAAHQALADRDN